MMPKTYEKPKMTFVSLENQENIANTCWGNHGTGYKYYDTLGVGYVAFTIEAKSCTAADGALQMYYYDSKDDKEPEQIFAGDQHYDEAYNKLIEVSGGSYGQPFKGEDNFPDTPGGMS